MKYKKLVIFVGLSLFLGLFTALLTDRLVVRQLNEYSTCQKTGIPRYGLSSCSQAAVSESGWPFTSSYTLANGQRKSSQAEFSVQFEVEPQPGKNYNQGKQLYYNGIIFAIIYVPVLLYAKKHYNKNWARD